jgi:hypothetical protein
MKFIAAMLVLFAASLFAQGPSKPQISAFFDHIDDGPIFFVECLNTSGETLSSGAEGWTNALRIDGAIVPGSESRLASGSHKESSCRRDLAGQKWRLECYAGTLLLWVVP